MEEKYNIEDLQKYSKNILYTLANALKNPDYFNSITTSTGDKSKVTRNFYYSYEVLEKGMQE